MNLKQGYVDCIHYDDVCLHIIFPWKVLQRDCFVKQTPGMRCRAWMLPDDVRTILSFVYSMFRMLGKSITAVVMRIFFNSSDNFFVYFFRSEEH